MTNYIDKDLLKLTVVNDLNEMKTFFMCELTYHVPEALIDIS